MNTKIITKFTIATEQGLNILLMLTREIAKEKFSNLLEVQVLDKYIADNFNEKSLIVEVNSMSNQWLVVYADDEPAGYVRITSKGKRPVRLEQKRSMRIADFGILNKYSDPMIMQSLFEKCMTVCRSYEALWINEYMENPLLDFLERKDFVRENENWQHDELPLASVCFIKDQEIR
ncbi:MAG: N-acetyltransferase [Pedobacter sp.]|uniref:N-acetyltransferase n=1 Tax=Pedobacter sp. TaxID=1411316 RepID=UPI003569F275